MAEKLKKRIINIQNELRITKDGENTFSKYSYFQPDTVLRLLNPLLQKHNVFSKFDLLYQEQGQYYKGVLTLSDVETEESEIYTFDILKATVKGANEAQNSGATLTYAKRYSLMNAFNIAEDSSDFDSNEHAQREAKAKSKRDFVTETENIETKEDYEKWWNSLSESESQEAYKVKQNVLYKLTRLNIEKTISSLKSTSNDKTLSTIDNIISEEKDLARKEKLIEAYNSRLEKVGLTHRYEKTPFED